MTRLSFSRVVQLAADEQRFVDHDRTREMLSVPELLEHLPDYVVQVNAEGTILYINRRAPDGGELSVVGTKAATHLAPDDARLLAENLERAREGVFQTFEIEAYGRWFSVRCVPVVRDGKVDLVTLIATDIDDERRALRALRASELNARALLQALPDMVFRIRRDGTIVDYQAENQAQLVANPDQIVGGRFQDMLPPHAAGPLLEAVERSVDDGTMQRVEYALEIAGEEQHFEARITATAPDEVVSIVRDVTDKVHAERQREANARLASLSTLVAGVAHEINNPLAYMMLNLSSLASALGGMQGDDVVGSDVLDQLRAKVLKSLEGAQNIRHIVRNLSAVTGSNEGEEPVAVASVVDWAVAMVEGELGRHTTIERRYGEVRPVRANRRRLSQVFLNLMLNAWQALDTADDTAEQLIEVATEQAGDDVIIEVRDSGRGILPEHRERVFEPFFTTRGGDGTGLGLWVCHNVITSYGGRIDIESVPGEGTTVRVRLPALAAA